MDTEKISITGATRLASCSSTTVRRWLQSGELQGDKIDGTWMIDRNNLMHHLQKIGTHRKGYSRGKLEEPTLGVGVLKALQDSLHREQKNNDELKKKIEKLEDKLEAKSAEIEAILKAQNMGTIESLIGTVKAISKWRTNSK